MPRIKLVANDHDVYGKPLRYAGSILGEPITRSFRTDIARAVDADHHCDDSSCDIREALESGYPYCAAHSLMSATDELPHVYKTIEAHVFNQTLPAGFGTDLYDNTDWPGWKEHFDANAVECESCGSYNFDSETCGSCLAELTGSDE